MTTSVAPRPPTTAAAPPTRRRRGHGWAVPLSLLAAAFVAFSLPPYLTLDVAQSRLEPPTGDVLYYPALVAHVVFASVAMLAGCLQVWPAVRSRFPKLHRRCGRLYVLAGVLPASVVAYYLILNTPFGPSAMVSGLMMNTLWICFTLAGFRAARRGRFADHRSWMYRSFALTMSIIVNRMIGFPITFAMYSQLDTTFQGSEELLLQSSTSIVTWLSWTLALLFAEWRISSKTSRRKAAVELAARR